jgi:Ala-tRNA(Pro) deacylase
MQGSDTKSLFVRDKKGRNHFLVIVGYEKIVNLKALSRELGVSGLSLGSTERLRKHLGVDPGSVSLLAITNDQHSQVEVIIDEKLWVSDRWKCHPLVNTSTLSISRNDVERLLNITNHAYRVIDVPELN